MFSDWSSSVGMASVIVGLGVFSDRSSPVGMTSAIVGLGVFSDWSSSVGMTSAIVGLGVSSGRSVPSGTTPVSGRPSSGESCMRGAGRLSSATTIRHAATTAAQPSQLIGDGLWFTWRVSRARPSALGSMLPIWRSAARLKSFSEYFMIKYLPFRRRDLRA